MRIQFPSIDQLAISTQGDGQALDATRDFTFPASDPVSMTFHSPAMASSQAAHSSCHHLHGKFGLRVFDTEGMPLTVSRC